MHILIAHVGEQLHILAHLLAVLILRPAELEVDDNHFFSVGHHAVRTMPHHLRVGGVDVQDGALVEELPTAAEPVGHFFVGQPFLEHGAQAIGRDVVVVEHALELQLAEYVGDIFGGSDVREEVVQDVTHLDVGLLLAFLVVAINEVAATVALLKVDGCGKGVDFDFLQVNGLLEHVVALLVLLVVIWQAERAEAEVYETALFTLLKSSAL